MGTGTTQSIPPRAKQECDVFIYLQSLTDKWEDLRRKLRSLPDKLSEKGPCTEDVSVLAEKVSPGIKDITAVSVSLNAAIEQAESNLADAIGLEFSEGAPPDLTDRLTAAVVSLEKGLSCTFPLLTAVKLDAVILSDEGATASDLLDALDERLLEFFNDAAERIRKRLAWWEKETAPGSKSALLLMASRDYDPDTMQCPVCEQRIADLPVSGELASLRDTDPELCLKVKSFFRELEDELKELVPVSLENVASKPVNQRLLDDWANVRDGLLGEDFMPITADYDSRIVEIATAIAPEDVDVPCLIPDKTERDGDFFSASVAFVSQVGRVYKALAALRWSRAYLDVVFDKVTNIITNKTSTEKPSLLYVLAQGKEAAAVVKPLKGVRGELREMLKGRAEITDAEEELALLQQIKIPLDKMKILASFAASEVGRIFEAIKDKTIEYCDILYPESPTGMKPGRLTMAKGRDKSIEALLSRETFEVPGQYFANAGLQRAIALSFYSALLEVHPRGLGFVLMDDPILSLDEDHRERWTLSILRPKMKDMQIVLATHQRKYLSNCGHHFEPECVIELNPRDRARRISRRPGHRLLRTQKEMASGWSVTPTMMRMYREEVLTTLDAYSPTPFCTMNWRDSLAAYDGFKSPHPLAGKPQRRIVATFKDPRVEKVLDPGSHAMTQEDVTKPMAQDCLSLLMERDGKFRSELDRLERLRAHALRGAAISAALIPFNEGALPVSWSDTFRLQTIGRAAARMGPFTIDLEEEVAELAIRPGDAVLASSTCLDPVVKCGQWVLLDRDDVAPSEGDLVAAIDGDGNRYLRRIWSEDERWVMHPINPVHPVPSVSSEKTTAAVRRIMGVLYAPSTVSSFSARPGTVAEWDPEARFDVSRLRHLRGVEVEGDSLVPIARQGQMVLVTEGQSAGDRLIEGSLAVVETEGEIGNVIKRVFPGPDSWVLVSPNPVEAVKPVVVQVPDIRRVWPVVGVLFEYSDALD